MSSAFIHTYTKIEKKMRKAFDNFLLKNVGVKTHVNEKMQITYLNTDFNCSIYIIVGL